MLRFGLATVLEIRLTVERWIANAVFGSPLWFQLIAADRAPGFSVTERGRFCRRSCIGRDARCAVFMRVRASSNPVKSGAKPGGRFLRFRGLCK